MLLGLLEASSRQEACRELGNTWEPGGVFGPLFCLRDLALALTAQGTGVGGNAKGQSQACRREEQWTLKAL